MGLYSSPPPARPFGEDKATLLTSWWITAMCAIIIVLRLIGRYIRVEELFREDIVAAFTLIPLFLRMAFIHPTLLYGTNNVLIDSNLQLSDIEIQHRSIASRLVLVGRILHPAILWLLKAVTVMFFDKLVGQSGKNRYTLLLRFMRASLAFTFFAVVVADLAECQPFTHYWQVLPDPGGRCRQGYAHLVTLTVCNVFTDLLLVVFPVPIVVKSRLSAGRKTLLVMLFCLHLFTVLVALYRVPGILREGGYQATRTMWASAEILMATFAANALTLGSFVRDTGAKKKKFRYQPSESELRSGRRDSRVVKKVSWNDPDSEGEGKPAGRGTPKTHGAGDSQGSADISESKAPTAEHREGDLPRTESLDSLIPRSRFNTSTPDSARVFKTTTIEVTVSSALNADKQTAEEMNGLRSTPSANRRTQPSGSAGMRDHQEERYYDIRSANTKTASTLLARELKGRHLQMIAISGSIGTGLFVASGKALSEGGPASVLLAYLIVGVMLWCTVQALGEMAVVFPVAGSFSVYSTRFLDPSWGFAMGWNYALQWIVVLPLEIIAGALTIEYWDSSLDKAIFVTVFLIVIVVINLCGIRGYGEAEFLFAIVKVVAVVGFILLGIVINIGGTPTSGYIGGKYWRDPGAFNNGFKGLCSVFVTAAFAFAGTELVGLAAAETANPRKSLPTAIKQVFWRITLFYIVSLTLVGLLVPYNEPRLIGATSIADASASPFVIAIESAGTTILPSIMNGVILVSVISVGNSSVFGSSRTLAALAEQGQAPKLFAYIDRRGRPLVAILAVSSVGLLAYLANYQAHGRVFDWLLAISGLSTIFTWASTCLAHIRLRQAWAYRHRSVSDMAFRAQAGVLGSWVGFVCNVVILIAQLWVAISPLTVAGGEGEAMTASERAQGFFVQCLALPVVLVFWLGHKMWFRTSFVKVEDMDIDTGRRDFGRLGIIKAQEEEERHSWPKWKRFYRHIC
ncbi:general amino-acid permease [Chaetomidium leptoderma]|uniref:General amino-acid permease n=1 Tax=Chaetomidium leptoderma TaxID=669021 RepID=A0AAN6ZSI2_9PEZI|nr:general amino-acid permease [Chaetomidium leptoderma]